MVTGKLSYTKLFCLVFCTSNQHTLFGTGFGLQYLVNISAKYTLTLVKALLRPGRLDRLVYVPLPDLATRSSILRIQLAKMPVDSDLTVEKLALETDGYSGAEVSSVDMLWSISKRLFQNVKINSCFFLVLSFSFKILLWTILSVRVRWLGKYGSIGFCRPERVQPC